MKSSTVLRLSLLIPYILWGIAAGIVMLIIPLTNPSIESGKRINAIALPAIIYVDGIFLWGIPYTLLALGLWIWSRGKDVQRIIRVFAFSPFMLAILISVEMLTFSINMSVLFMVELVLAYGYLCIGIAGGIYRILKSLNKLE